jgi:hypothetical protein
MRASIQLREKMLGRLNEVYARGMSAAELRLLKGMKRKVRRVVRVCEA